MGNRNKIHRALTAMNSSLEAAQAVLFDPEADPGIPQIFIVGPPRSGKVLANSVLCHCLDLGYIDNVVNRFWRAPLFGIRLSQDLVPSRPGMRFKSCYGLTPDVWGAGEFPFFWQSWLGGYESPLPEEVVDWQGLCALLTQMGHALGFPLVHQSLAVFRHLGMLAKRLENVLFVRLRRDLIDNGMSILKMREDYHGDRNRWHSVRPTNTEQVEHRDWAGQISGQLLGIYRDLDAMTAGYDVIDMTYADMCHDPNLLVDAVSGWVGGKGYPVERLHETPEPFTPSVHPQNTDREALVQALARDFGEPLAEAHRSGGARTEGA